MRLKELLGAITPLKVAGRSELDIAGVCHDSRRARRGDLFFALAGSRTDGNRHARQACERGAVAVASELDPPPPPVVLDACWIQVADITQAMGRLCDRFFGHPSQAMTVVGVTGTKGKTTTTYFLESIFSQCGAKPAVIGTVDHRLGGKRLEKAINTTPISLELLSLLARFRDGGATHVAMEVSSHALALKRADEVDFNAAVFTNLGRDHLDFHKSQDEYFQAKARLFELLEKPSSAKNPRVAVINADDAKAPALRRLARKAEPIGFGFNEGADLRARELTPEAAGQSFIMDWRGRSSRASIGLIGPHNALNALAAAGAALGLGLPLDGVRKGLSALKSVPGRLEPVGQGQPFRVLVDYAHTEEALSSVLGTLKETGARRLITVFGCGGDRDRGKRGPMGIAACRGSDLAIITSDNPRSEDPLSIIRDIEQGLKKERLKNYKIIPDRREAIGEAIDSAAEGDIVLIAGKGHEDYQILSDKTVPFDDREVARQALVRRGWLGRSGSRISR
ncbi:MAG: UDP-N-acetylmuramoyl-L-alanyl-D-glutamate--2,6-diaminopimelate ligase [Elusimicrobia bacterium]|nr:UDP-N-acetylmuramoyl-L-alanyl-D-glutamate--2,6-diaminopimelate ligase [Elusimicrobiota bacterium]